MNTAHTVKNLYAIIGYPLSHSFSPKYFTTKFEREQIPDSAYIALPIENIHQLPNLLQTYPNLRGLNVTLPYKQAVFEYLDEVDEGAATIGAVNTINIRDGQLKGYNTDAIGFEVSLKELLGGAANTQIKALVLGSGGAAKAVNYVLGQMGIAYQVVSRTAEKGDLTYEKITPDALQAHTLIVNTTPLGMHPNVNFAPNLPYEALRQEHFLYDLVYNPSETLFLKNGKDRGAAIMNGLKMLHLQAEAAWEIWNETP
ncbi:MAG: shikimate dehydrogenase [Bacteroidota bacterium]